jgi:hypothetical protein
MITALLLWRVTFGGTPDETQPVAPTRFDIHAAMRTGGTTACAHCHEEDPDAALRIPAAQTCSGCHYRTVHAGTAEHLVVLPAPMLPGVQRAGLPLDGDRISCLTCHDPHPAGSTEHRPVTTEPPAVPEAWRAALLGEPAVVQSGDMLRLPLAGGVLCVACHGNSPAPERTP